MKEFFFVEQDGQQVAMDCLSIVQPTEQNSASGGEVFIRLGEDFSMPPVMPRIPLDRPQLRPDRLILFHTPL